MVTSDIFIGFDFVYRFKSLCYNFAMKFKVVKHLQAQKEYDSLLDHQKNLLDNDFKTIQQKGIEYVKRRSLGDGLFEIKTDELRSLFGYRKGQIIIVSLIYIKQGQKAPKEKLKLVRKRLKEGDTI